MYDKNTKVQTLGAHALRVKKWHALCLCHFAIATVDRQTWDSYLRVDAVGTEPNLECTQIQEQCIETNW